MNLSGSCPICDALITLDEEVEETEILSCQDCQSVLVVDEVQNTRIILNQAPQIEEDWGE